MMLSPGKRRALSVFELSVCLVVISALVAVAWPMRAESLTRARITMTLANARSLQQATQMLTLDTMASKEDGIQWTMWAAAGKAPVSIPLATFLGALTKDGYLTEADLRKVLTAPDIGPGEDPITADDIAFKFYEVEEMSPSDQVFVTTRNISPPDGAMEEGVNPYGTKGFVYFTKGGGGGVRVRGKDATSREVFPMGQPKDGAAYRYVVLK